GLAAGLDARGCPRRDDRLVPVVVRPGDGMTIGGSQARSEHFRQRGLIQQYGAFFVRLGLLLDSGIIFVALYLLTRHFDISWAQRYSALSLFMILTFEMVAYFRHLYRSWRLIRLRR